GVRTEEHTAEEAAPPVLTSSTPGDRNSYDYQQDPALYQSQDQILKQYEERLRANKNASQAEAVDFSQQIQAELTQVASPAEVNPVADEAATIVDPAAFLLTSNSIVDQAIRDRVPPRFRSACLVFNPVAGQNEPEQDLAIIQGILQPYMNLDIRITTLEVDASQLAREAVERGVELLIASGGDGTLSAVAEAVVGTGVPLGVISRGTANAFATALGIPATIEVACETILEGVTRVIDAASCNGKPMVLLAGIGFEAEAVERADREAKNRFGMLAYVLAGVQSLRDMQSFETRIETEDKVITCQAAAVTIANAAPPTSVLAQGPAELLVDDGLLDITLVAPANSISAIAAAYTLLQSASSGTTTDRPDTGYLRARSIKVTTDPPQKVVLDGELIGYTPIEVECIPGGLTILVPDLLKKAPAEKLEGLPGLQIEYKEPPAEQR
ncbi:MAG TPA: YegS/Rv2252/BmrU family lipid kinase, partial [Candidatus Caenarcaniphilales bacterium]